MPRWRLAQLLAPAARRDDVADASAGAAADAYFRSLSSRVGRPRTGCRLRGLRRCGSGRPGEATASSSTCLQAARAILRAATRPIEPCRAAHDRSRERRNAIDRRGARDGHRPEDVVVQDVLTRVPLTGSRTCSSGPAALDGTLVAPGGTFSLNDAIGERTAERGFRSAPVIIGNEYAEEVGRGHLARSRRRRSTPRGGGPPDHASAIPHSLYISRYQLGRDATVYWPSLDPQVRERHRRVGARQRASPRATGSASRSTAARADGSRARATPLGGTDRVPVERIEDPTLAKGKTVVDEEGTAPTRTSATPGDLRALTATLIRSRDVDDVVRGREAVVRHRARRSPSRSPQPKARGRQDHHGHDAWLLPEPKNRPVAIAATSQLGTRGRTVGLAVDRARGVCSRRRRARVPRSTRYSYVKRAPRTSTQRAQTVERLVEVRGAVVAQTTSVVSASRPRSRIDW